MKKYLITSLVSVTASIVLIVYLYRTKDIEWVDVLVERSTALVGITPEIVNQKKEARAQRSREAAADIKPLLIPLDTMTLEPVANIDSSAVVKPLFKKPRRLFNLTKDSVAELPASIDTIKRAKADAPRKKKQLFNIAVETPPASPGATEPTASGKAPALVYFKAEVNERQQFDNDEEIVFRTVEVVPVGGRQVPARHVFRAKANVFGGRIVFVLKNLDDLTVDGQNYTDQQKGLPVGAVSRLGRKYLLSDGFPMVFGVHL